jgi:1,4-dihydroxy-2-naphthoate octaprenyltransferase
MIEAKAPSRRSIWIDLLLYPQHTLPTAAAPVIVAGGLAVHYHVFAPLPLLLGFLASWLIHLGGVLTDNYVLISRHADVPEHPELLAALKDGSLSLGGLNAVIVFCFVLAVLPGPYLLHYAGIPAIVLGAVGIAASLSYSLTPYSLTRIGIADPVFFLMFGVVAVAGAYYVQAAPAYGASAGSLIIPQALPSSAFVLGLPAGALITNVLLIDDMCDRGFDTIKGWRTGSVRFGLGWTRREILALTALAYVLPFWFWLGLGFSPWVLLSLLTLPEAISVAGVVRRSDKFENLRPMTIRTARLAVDHSVLLAIGIAVFAH